MRKIIQIAATPDVEIIALCDDGSIWIAHSNGFIAEKWRRLPDIPQHNRPASDHYLKIPKSSPKPATT